MPAKLTQAEKDARGTRQKCRDTAPRPVAQVKRDIRDARSALKDLQFNLKSVGESIRKDGPIIEVTVLDGSGNPHTTQKAHPALKVQREALAGIQTLKRSLVLLREELALATAAKKDDSEFSDFD